MTALLIAILAGLAAAGLLLAAAGLAGTEVVDISPPASPSRFSVGRLAGPVLVGGAVYLASGWPLAAGLAVLATWHLPRLLGGRADRKAAIARTDAIASWTEMIRDSITAAAGLEEAIAATAPVAPAALRLEVTTLARRLEHERLPASLVKFGQQVGHPSCDHVVAALSLAARLEANDLSSLLSRLAESARHEARMRVRIEVGRTRVRTATSVIVGVVLAAVALLTVANRGYLDAYDTASGQVVLAVVGAVFGIGAWLLSRMAAIEMPERFVARIGELEAS